MQVPKRRSEQNIKRDDGPFYVTGDGLLKMQRQLKRLERELPALIAEVDRTKGFGDFSENAEYQDAKHKMRRTHTRILTIKDRIFRAAIIGKSSLSDGRVRIGSTVVLDSNGKRITYGIVGSYETDPARGRISHESPLGQALLGKRAGETATLSSKAGIVSYLIVSVV